MASTTRRATCGNGAPTGSGLPVRPSGSCAAAPTCATSRTAGATDVQHAARTPLTAAPGTSAYVWPPTTPRPVEGTGRRLDRGEGRTSRRVDHTAASSMRPGRWWRREGLGGDAVAGLVLGVESVPDGLAAGLLAGVNPVAGLHAYLFGTIGGALFTSSTFLAVQATGAMSIIVADVPAVHEAPDPPAALFTLSFLTGAVMVVAGVARMGAVLRFVSHSVVVGFVSAVGVNIILGQLGNFTGYDADGSSRLARAFDTLTHPGRLDGATLAVGTATILLILALERTRLGPLGLVVAVVATSGAAALVGAAGVAVLADLTTVPGSLPLPQLPTLRLIPSLVVPALSLAFVGLVQGAAISASVPNPDGASPDASRDFIGQGVGNLVSGAFQGMPVGGSMSASRLNRSAGARSRLALVLASVVMAVVILLFSAPVGHIAMPALAALLMLIGYRTVKPADLESVWRTGT